MAAMAGETNVVRLETAFRVAETELGVARLLDPEVRRTWNITFEYSQGCLSELINFTMEYQNQAHTRYLDPCYGNFD